MPRSIYFRRRIVAAGVLVLLVVGVVALVIARIPGPPGCTVTLATAPDRVLEYPLTVEQADNAATIAGVGRKLGMPDHAVTVAIATAMQETGLRNLPHGDRDSLGLFQQRPSQGWGSEAQLMDTVYASTAFYQRLRQQSNWTRLEVTDAAQLVQRSATPLAYARWEPIARAAAAALTGEAEASLACRNLKLAQASPGTLVRLAERELGTAALSGAQPPERGRALANWSVGHAARAGLDRVSMNGSSWTAESGEWAEEGPPDGQLRLRQSPPDE